jgi:hypothetical protein
MKMRTTNEDLAHPSLGQPRPPFTTRRNRFPMRPRDFGFLLLGILLGVGSVCGTILGGLLTQVGFGAR